jgi:hypothetical protein
MLQDLKYREQYEKNKGRNTFNLDANEFQAAKNLQTLASDRLYQQVYNTGAEEESEDDNEYDSEDERIYREYMERLAHEEYMRQLQLQEEQQQQQQQTIHEQDEEDEDEDYEEQQHFANADGYEREQQEQFSETRRYYDSE